jgi:uncharacterized protein (DUF2147 family)
MKKNVLLIACLLFSASIIYAQADKVNGIWVPAKGTSQVKIYRATDGKYYGQVVWMDEKEKLDVNNPNEKLRKQKILGTIVLRNFTYNAGKKQWVGGTIYDPDNGKTYDCYMWFEGDDNLLKIRGYVLGMRFLGRSENWKRENALRK